MNFLALDTSSPACSVAAQAGHQFAHRHVVEPRAHSKILMPMIVEVLQDIGIRLRDLHAVVLGNGPGSFIGLRIGASVAQGLCFGAGLELVPVSSLAAIAAEAFDTSDARRVAVAQDARMGEVYLGCFERSVDDHPVPIGEEKIVAANSLSLPHGEYSLAGGVWDQIVDLQSAEKDRLTTRIAVLFPDARYLLRIGAKLFADGKGQAPDELEPAYLRTKVAAIPTSRG